MPPRRRDHKISLVRKFFAQLNQKVEVKSDMKAVKVNNNLTVKMEAAQINYKMVLTSLLNNHSHLLIYQISLLL